MTERLNGDLVNACPEVCGCAEGDDCDYFAFGYAWCAGCGEHHRPPVALVGPVCPVDLWATWFDQNPGGRL